MASWTAAATDGPSPTPAVPPGRSVTRTASVLRSDASTTTRARQGALSKPESREIVSAAWDSIPTIDELPLGVLDGARYFLAALPSGDEEVGLPGRLGFTSALAGEGVTYVAHAVAIALAHDLRERVCVIDLNWSIAPPHGGRDRSVTRKSGKGGRALDGAAGEQRPGLADVLRREVPLREVLLETREARLSYVTAGAATPAEGQVFAHSERLSQVLDTLERHNDRLILDLPPVLASSAAIPLARRAGGIAVVVREGVTTEAQVRSACERLGQIPSLGIVLNRASSKIPRPLLRRISNW